VLYLRFFIVLSGVLVLFFCGFCLFGHLEWLRSMRAFSCQNLRWFGWVDQKLKRFQWNQGCCENTSTLFTLKWGQSILLINCTFWSVVTIQKTENMEVNYYYIFVVQPNIFIFSEPTISIWNNYSGWFSTSKSPPQSHRLKVTASKRPQSILPKRIFKIFLRK
jgi:hypothetical protein